MRDQRMWKKMRPGQRDSQEHTGFEKTEIKIRKLIVFCRQPPKKKQLVQVVFTDSAGILGEVGGSKRLSN